jgi:hypothetical protein
LILSFPAEPGISADSPDRGCKSIGYVDVDCFWKWRELALLAGSKPA